MLLTDVHPKSVAKAFVSRLNDLASVGTVFLMLCGFGTSCVSPVSALSGVDHFVNQRTKVNR